MKKKPVYLLSHMRTAGSDSELDWEPRNQYENTKEEIRHPHPAWDTKRDFYYVFIKKGSITTKTEVSLPTHIGHCLIHGTTEIKLYHNINTPNRSRVQLSPNPIIVNQV